jgi:tetratricopeptide (TPR) repeat protein
VPLPLLARSCSILCLSVSLLAQGTTPVPAAAAKGDELRKAFVDADGSRRLAISAAADKVLAADKAGRAQFMATLRAITAVAPPATEAPAAAPAPAAGGATPPPPPKPPEFADDVKKLMTDAIGGDPEAQKASLGKLTEDKTNGTAALAQLDTRGKAILARCVSQFVRKKLETNAIFAGQYTDLKDFNPEASDLLLRWAKEAPREVANPDQFRTACLRALRDTLAADAANDRVRADMKEIATKAQQGRSQDLFLTAACALLQFGDSSLFDRLKENVQKQAEGGTDEQKTGAANMLAELHYQARKYEEAANYYKAYIAALEKLPETPPGMPTYIYNTACSLALAGKVDEALTYLEKALAANANSERPLTKVLIDSDHDIDALRKDERFTALYEKHFGKPK